MGSSLEVTNPIKSCLITNQGTLTSVFFNYRNEVNNMNVYGKNFIFNGISSEKYNLVLCSIDSHEPNRETGILHRR